jgi:hypothetical protein
MERLTIRSKNSDMVWFKDAENGNAHLEPCEMTAHHNRMALDKLATYEDAEEQGQILRLPCKVGDTVYAFLSTCNYFTECQINKIELKPTLYGNTCYFLEPIGHRGCLYRCFEDEFGKTVFLTKEEAEAKLKEMSCFQNGNN